jgi:hypothetical protein
MSECHNKKNSFKFILFFNSTDESSPLRARGAFCVLRARVATPGNPLISVLLPYYAFFKFYILLHPPHHFTLLQEQTSLVNKTVAQN